MAEVTVTDDGRVILVGEEAKIDIWAFLEPDARARAATFLLKSTRVSGKIDVSTMKKLKDACEHRLEEINKFVPAN